MKKDSSVNRGEGITAIISGLVGAAVVWNYKWAILALIFGRAISSPIAKIASTALTAVVIISIVSSILGVIQVITGKKLL